MTHQLLRHTDDGLPLGHGTDLPQGFGIEGEALDHVLAAGDLWPT